MSVDVERAHAADTLATVVVENERLFAALDELLVQDVEHFEEGSIGGDILHFKCVEMTLCLRTILTPHLQCE